MVVAEETDMEIQSTAIQARLQSQSDRILRQAEDKTPEGYEKEEGSIGRGEGVPKKFKWTRLQLCTFLSLFRTIQHQAISVY